MRLTSQIWVSAYLRRCASEAVPAVVLRRGNAEAGAIFISVDRLDGMLHLYEPAPTGLKGSDTSRFWVRCFGGEAATEEDVATYVARQLKFDPDLWVIAIEDRHGRHFLEGNLIEV